MQQVWVVVVVGLVAGWQLVSHDGHVLEVRTREGNLLMYLDASGKWVLNAACPTPAPAPLAAPAGAASTEAGPASFAMHIDGVVGAGKGVLA